MEILDRWGESEGPLKYASPKRQLQSVAGDRAGETISGFLGLDPAAFDSPKEALYSGFPTYTTGRILNAGMGKPADEQTFWKNVGTGAGAEALAGAAYFGGAYAAGAGPFAGSGAGAPAAGGGAGAPGTGGPAGVLGHAWDTQVANEAAAYQTGLNQPWTMGNELGAPLDAGGPSFLGQFANAAKTYSQAQQQMGPTERPAPPPTPSPIGPPGAPAGPLNLSPQQIAAALSGGRGPVLPAPISQRLLR